MNPSQFPKGNREWRQWVEQWILMIDADVKRLWRRMPQGWRGTDGEMVPAQFPLQQPPTVSVSGSDVTAQSGPALTGTQNTAGTPGALDCGDCGSASWVWDETTASWALFVDNTASGCNPVEPTTPGTYDGQVVVTCGEESLSGTPMSGTPRSGCDCGQATWSWNGSAWQLIANDCTGACTPVAPGQAGTTIGQQQTTCCDQVTGTADTGASLSGTYAPSSGTASGSRYLLRIRMRSDPAATDLADATVGLYQGATNKGGIATTVSNTWAMYSTYIDAATISDITDLRVRIASEASGVADAILEVDFVELDLGTGVILRPMDDVTVGSWLTSPLWSKVDEAEAGSGSGDNTTITGPVNSPDTNTCELALSDPPA